MFKTNSDCFQTDLFDLFLLYPKSLWKQMRQSEAYCFHPLILSKIKEENVSVLSSFRKNRPYAPIHVLTSALILYNCFLWMCEGLIKQIKFATLTKLALGLKRLADISFCPATIFNFQNGLNKHFVKTGEDLLEDVFDELTEEQLKKLKIKTDIQRIDSFAAPSNIRNYSRLQLLLELLIRLYRVLSQEDQRRFSAQFGDSIKKGSGQYICKRQASDLPDPLEKMGKSYHWIDRNLKSCYSGRSIFRIFEPVYQEHFTIDRVQSPDDLDATYRSKRGKPGKGQSLNIVETAHPDNPINLVDDVAVNLVNKDDSRVLTERLDKVVEKTPDLTEFHVDGGYGSEENDEKFAEYEIIPVQIGARGKAADVETEISQPLRQSRTQSKTEYRVTCPNQEIPLEPPRTRHRAEFDRTICEKENCPTMTRKNCPVYYFTHADYVSKKRQKIMTTLPPGRRKLGCKVEATVNEFTCRLRKGQLKDRGAFTTLLFACRMAMAINFGRMYRNVQDNKDLFLRLFCYLVQFCKRQLLYLLSFLHVSIHSHRNYEICINGNFLKP